MAKPPLLGATLHVEHDGIRAVPGALERERVEYVLVGATALSLHGIIRATEDIDLFVRPAADNVERLRRALRSVWDDPDIDQIRLEDLAGEFPTIRYARRVRTSSSIFCPAWASLSATPTNPGSQTADDSLQYDQREWSDPEYERIIKIFGESFQHMSRLPR